MSLHESVAASRESTFRAAQRHRDSLQYWSEIVRAVYLQIPGLSLTRSQLQRLWALDIVLSDTIVDALVGARFLRETPAGRFVADER